MNAGTSRISHRQRGISLAELLIGMVLGVVLIGGAVSIYLASKRSFVEVEQVAALSENARFAQQVIGSSLRHAGFFGEFNGATIQLDAAILPVVGDCSGLASAHDLGQFVFAASAASKDVLACIDDAYVPTNGVVNDVLVIKRVLPQPLLDSPRPHDPTQDDGVISFPRTLQADKTYVMANSSIGIMFDGSTATPPDISAGGAMPGSSAWEYAYEVYYVRDGATPQLSRKRLQWTGAAMELITEDLTEGVENLRLMFGFDQDNDGEVEKYTNLAGVVDWSQVSSIEVYMLVRTPAQDAQYTDDKTYQLGDVAVTPGDNFRRLPVYSSISMRNPKLILRGGA